MYGNAIDWWLKISDDHAIFQNGKATCLQHRKILILIFYLYLHIRWSVRVIAVQLINEALRSLNHKTYFSFALGCIQNFNFPIYFRPFSPVSTRPWVFKDLHSWGKTSKFFFEFCKESCSTFQFHLKFECVSSRTILKFFGVRIIWV